MTSRLTLLLCVLLIGLSIHAQEIIHCPNAPESQLVIGQQAQIIAEGGINMRERPNTLAEILVIVPQDEIIPVIDGAFCGEGYAWWQVDYDGQRGWIAEGTGEFYWMQPYLVQSAQVGTIRIETTPELTSIIDFERYPDSIAFFLPDIPNEFPLQVVDSAIRVTEIDSIVSPTYPDLVRDILESEDITLLGGIAERFSNVQFLELENGKGVRYTTIAFAPINSIRAEGVTYNFVGIANGYLIQTQQIVIPPAEVLESLLIGELLDNLEEYFADTQSTLNALSPADFSPALNLFDNLMMSIQTSAPLIESDVFHFDYEGALQFEYNPMLAYEITATPITDSDLPNHLQFELMGYPIAGEATLRVFDTAKVDNNWLVSLQQILSRQPNNPPYIPILSHDTESATHISEVIYLNNGIRALVTYDDGLFYTYQAFSEDRQFYLSLLLPIANDYPPLPVLDALVTSIIVP